MSSDAGVLTRIGVFTLPDLQSLERIGGGLLAAPEGVTAGAVPDTSSQVVQGSVESSNVDAATEVTRLIAIQQAYQRASRLIDSENELKKQMLGRLGRPSV